MRPSARNLDQMRNVTIETGVMKHAEGSCLIKMGETHVLCSASIEDKAPPFLKNTGQGWVTAEYGMLTRATNTRNRREAARASNRGGRRRFSGLSGGRCVRVLIGAPWGSGRSWWTAMSCKQTAEPVVPRLPGVGLHCVWR